MPPDASTAGSGLSTERLGRVTRWMEALVEGGTLAGISVGIERRGVLAYRRSLGMADRERGRPMADDTIVRIYSMTKPLVSAAILMLYEEGRFQLDDPITRWLPSFRNQRVLDARGTVAAERPISFRDLLTHTSGLTYGFIEEGALDARYRAEGIDFQTSGESLETLVRRAASLPLLCQPGSAWNYSIATDVLGHLVELVSGRPLSDFLEARILRPLGMADTGFHVPPDRLQRFAACYNWRSKGRLFVLDDPQSSRFADPAVLQSGGGGLCSTAGDYLQFCRMLLGGGELAAGAGGGVRLLGRKTVELMTRNHLAGEIAACRPGRPREPDLQGIGFGLGVSVMLDPARAQIVGSAGEYGWSGAASTSFWIDPAESMIVILLAQLMPASATAIARELRVLAYQAIMD